MKMASESSEDESTKAKMAEAVDQTLEKLVVNKSKEDEKKPKSLRRDKKSFESSLNNDAFSEDFQRHLATKLAAKLDQQIVEERVKSPDDEQQDESIERGVKLFSDSKDFVDVDDKNQERIGKKRSKPDLLAHRRHSNQKVKEKRSKKSSKSSANTKSNHADSTSSSDDNEDVKSVAVSVDWIKNKNTV